MRVKLDAGDDRPGAKFYKWEMKGVPIRLEVGPKDIQKGVVTLARRDGVKRAVPQEGLVDFILREAGELQALLYNRALQFTESRIKEVWGVEEARAQVQRGVALLPWCGSEDCGHALEEGTAASMLGEPHGLEFQEAACPVCGKMAARRTYMARQY